ncbi:hypothetical protein L596_016152 [Steinernema carpocapsae]|uniref:Uncharacterized protein n=1 Tax=Steinernema carpocapsae TaxID=34508 RepID=A0A4U5NHR4_STECR|nr:hypothetical protein L596_016152 [Steinernema carpocapsae]
MNVRPLLLVLAVCVVCSSAVPAVWNRENLEKFSQFLDEMTSNSNYPQLAIGFPPFEERPSKRSRCLINAGLSQGCDLSDVLMARMHHNKFSSFAGPGK